MATHDDWRTDTAERPRLVLDDHTRAIPPVLVPGESALPATSGDLGEVPPPARWPLYADEPVAGPADPAGPAPASVPASAPAQRSTLPGRAVTWVAAAAAVSLLAGGLGYATDGGDRVLTASVLTPGTREQLTEERVDGSSRGARREPPAEGSDAPEAGGEPGARRDDDRAPDRTVGRARPVAGVAVEAPSVARSTRDLDGERVDFDAANLVDGRPTTAWRTPGNARGTVLVLRLPRPTEITSVGVVNGYAKTGRDAGGAEVDWYDANRRVRRVEWFFDDGSRVVQQLGRTRQVQRTAVDGVRTSTVRLRIAGVSAPGGEAGGRDYTALSEVALVGVDSPRGSADE